MFRPRVFAVLGKFLLKLALIYFSFSLSLGTYKEFCGMVNGVER